MGEERLLSAELVEQVGDAPRRSDLAYAAIREAIIHHRIEPGAWLRLGALADEMRVSQTAVREALNRLAAEQLVTIEPYRGFQARTLTTDDLVDILEVASEVEGLAVQIAARRISEAELEEMRALLPQTFQVGTDRLAAFNANRRFYWIAISASGRKHAMRLIRQMMDYSQLRFLYAYMTEEERREEGNILERRNPAFLEALEARDGKQARRVVAGYYRDWVKLTQAVMPRIEEHTTNE
jgi:DNA-binding GntR family transcriptional regulator